MTSPIFTKFLLPKSYKFQWEFKNCCKQSRPKKGSKKDKQKESAGPTDLLDTEVVLGGDDRTKLLNSTIKIECPVDVSLISGIPQNQLEMRLARIFKPNKNPMQSGTANTNHWEVAFDNGPRWENPNMGWCSTGDPLSNLTIKFSSKEEAIEYCERNGWKWRQIREPAPKKYKVRTYAKNFIDKRCRVSTK